jgi:hypothetical protein
VGEKPKGGRKPETTRVKKETQEEKESGNSQTQCNGVDQSTVQRRRPMHNTKTPKKKSRKDLGEDQAKEDERS